MTKLRVLFTFAFSVESTALHLIMGLGSWEVQPQLHRVFSEPKAINLLSSESEELNRAMVLTLARAMHVTGKYFTVIFYIHICAGPFICSGQEVRPS